MQKGRALKYSVFVLAGVLLVLGLHFTRKWLKQVGFIPIQVVTFSNKLQHSDPALIKAAVTEHLKLGFFGLDMRRIRQDLIAVPWVANATVQRCWPDALKIKILERQPLAIWNDKGIVDTEGKLFFPSSLANLEDIPRFDGPEEYVNEMVDMYLLILSTLKPVGLAVKKLEIMSDQGWRAALDNGVTIVLGQTEIQERLARFVVARESVMAKGHDKDLTIDLRYTNGLSVTWRHS